MKIKIYILIFFISIISCEQKENIKLFMGSEKMLIDPIAISFPKKIAPDAEIIIELCYDAIDIYFPSIELTQINEYEYRVGLFAERQTDPGGILYHQIIQTSLPNNNTGLYTLHIQQRYNDDLIIAFNVEIDTTITYYQIECNGHSYNREILGEPDTLWVALYESNTINYGTNLIAIHKMLRQDSNKYKVQFEDSHEQIFYIIKPEKTLFNIGEDTFRISTNDPVRCVEYLQYYK